jgi:hypothetical protein
VLRRFSGVRDARDATIGYFSRVVAGLVACGVAAVGLRADVAAGAILATVMVLALAGTYVLLRGALP